MTKTKRILVTAVFVAIMAILPATSVKAISPMDLKPPLDENPLENNKYVKNIEAVFSDGTEGQFIDIDGNDILWTTRTTPVGNTNHDIVQLQYRVQKGDCLWKISVAFGIPLNQLLELNCDIENPDLIYVGDAIVLMILE